jgi:hypothetical protein
MDRLLRLPGDFEDRMDVKDAFLEPGVRGVDTKLVSGSARTTAQNS